MNTPNSTHSIEVAQFTALAPDATSSTTSRKAIQALQNADESHQFILGTPIQNKNEVQVTSVWDGTTLQPSPVVTNLYHVYGRPTTISHITLNNPAFGPTGAATAPVVEYAQSWFPTARVTPEFKKQIEADFLRFNEICEREASGNLGWAVGWVEEELEHENIEGKAMGFLVLRGWESMGDFERLVQSEAFGEAIPILMAWNVPSRMWHVERKS